MLHGDDQFEISILISLHLGWINWTITWQMNNLR